MGARLRIGIDACALRGALTGIGRYTWEICRCLDDLMPEARFFLYSPEDPGLELPSSRWRSRIGGSRLARRLSSYGWLKLHAGRMADRDGIQVFWSPRTLLPVGRGFATVATAHDLNIRLYPRAMPHVTRLAQRLWYQRDLRRADAVIANSAGTAERLRELLGVAVDTVARPGVSDCFHPRSPDQIAKPLNRLGIDRPYFLAVGTIEPRKNLAALVEAWLMLREQGLMRDCLLLIAGGEGWRNGSLARRIETAGEAGIRGLGHVADADLAALYAGAEAFVLPSVYEGFGMPLAEARACGARLVATDLPELREAGGPHARYVSPDPAAIAAGLLDSLDMPRPAPETAYRWTVAASRMADVFRDLARSVHGARKGET